MQKRHVVLGVIVTLMAVGMFLLLQTWNVESDIASTETAERAPAVLPPEVASSEQTPVPTVQVPSSRPAEVSAAPQTTPLPNENVPPAAGNKPAELAKTEKIQPANTLFDGGTSGFPKLDPKSLANLEKVRNLINANQPEAALEELEKVAKDDPRNEFYQVELAMMQTHTFRNAAKGEEILKRLTESNPTSRMAAAAYGDHLLQTGKPKQATKYLVQAASGPDAPTESHNHLGHHYFHELRNPQLAVPQFQIAEHKKREEIARKESAGESTLFARREAAGIKMNLAHALLAAGRREEAVAVAREAEPELGSDSQEVQGFRKAAGATRTGE